MILNCDKKCSAGVSLPNCIFLRQSSFFFHSNHPTQLLKALLCLFFHRLQCVYFCLWANWCRQILYHDGQTRFSNRIWNHSKAMQRPLHQSWWGYWCQHTILRGSKWKPYLIKNFRGNTRQFQACIAYQILVQCKEKKSQKKETLFFIGE